jgi:trk system potassium uptake protein TrkH
MSAVSTTGLVTVSVSDTYTSVGQVVVLLLIQFGGLGYMTFGSFVLLSGKKPLSETRLSIGRTVFSLPESFRLDKFVRSVMAFTVVIEAVGAVLLFFALRRVGAPDPLWSAVFHSVSAFCTAGFSLYNSSFEAYAGDFWLNAIISVLSYAGAIGFIVFVDCWRVFRRKVDALTLTSKIIISTSAWLLVIGTLAIFLGEPSLADLRVEDRLLRSFFQAMTAMTTVGFNTVPIGGLSYATLLVLMVLMVIGASPAGTGGGLKSTTLTAVIGVVRSALRGASEVRFWGRVVPPGRVSTAVASLAFYLFMLLLGTYLLELTQPFGFERNLFEAASAIGTVGLSTGITADLTPFGKIVVILLMFVGRLGVLTFGMALFLRSPGAHRSADGDLAV